MAVAVFTELWDVTEAVEPLRLGGGTGWKAGRGPVLMPTPAVTTPGPVGGRAPVAVVVVLVLVVGVGSVPRSRGAIG